MKEFLMTWAAIFCVLLIVGLSVIGMALTASWLWGLSEAVWWRGGVSLVLTSAVVSALVAYLEGEMY